MSDKYWVVMLWWLSNGTPPWVSYVTLRYGLLTESAVGRYQAAVTLFSFVRSE